MRRLTLSLAVILIACSRPCAGQTIDDDFSPVILQAATPNNILPLADGDLLVSGSFSYADKKRTVGGITRLTADGLLDSTFNLDVRITSAVVQAMAELPGGRLLLSGFFELADAASIGGVLRILPDGRMDPSFTPVSGFTGVIQSLTVFPDGKFAMGGSRGSTDLGWTVGLYLADGTPSPSFSGVTFSKPQSGGSYLLQVGHQHENALIVAGQDLEFGGNSQDVWRFDTLGHVDPDFAPVINSVYEFYRLQDMTIGEDGRLAFLDGSGYSITVVSADGDPAWSKTHFNHTLSRIRLIPSGDLLTTGSDVLRYDSLGNEKPLQLQTNDYYNVFDLASAQGALVLAGLFRPHSDDRTFGVARLVQNGFSSSLEIFPTRFFATGRVRAVLPQSDGGVIVAGNFERINGEQSPHLARLDRSGALDREFTSPATSLLHSYSTAVQLRDGRLVVAGGAYEKVAPRLQLLAADGTALNVAIPFDYPPGVSPTPGVTHLSVDGLDRVYAGTSFSFGYRQPTFRYRFGADGTVMEAVDFSTVALDSLHKYSEILVDAGDNLLLYGPDMLIGNTHTSIARLLPEGGYDDSFRPDLPDSSAVVAAALLPSGNIIVAVREPGYRFTPPPEGIRATIHKLRPDGSRIPDFGGTFNSSIYSPSVFNVFPLAEDELLVTGAFDQYRGRTVSRNAVIDSNGVYLRDLLPSRNGLVTEIARSTTDNAIYAAGEFTFPRGDRALIRLQLPPTATRNAAPAVRNALLAPNPNAGQPLSVILPHHDGPSVTGRYRLFELASGRLVASGSMTVADNKASLPVTAGLAPGSYLLVCSTASATWTGRLLRSE